MKKEVYGKMEDDISWIHGLPCNIPVWRDNCLVRNQEFLTNAGGIGIDIKLKNDDKSEIISLPSYQSDSIVKLLKAKTCSLPCFNANTMKESLDPCLKKFNIVKEKQRKFSRVYLSQRASIINHKKQNEIMQLRKRIEKGFFDFKRDKTPKYISKIFKHYPSTFSVLPNFNPMFLKGCLKIETMKSDRSYLFQPVGEAMSCLAITPILKNFEDENFECKFDFNNQLVVEMGGATIKQLVTSQNFDRTEVNCVVRKKHSLTYLTIVMGNTPAVKSKYVSSNKKSILSVDINPYFDGLLACTDVRGKLIVKDCFGDKNLRKMALDDSLLAYNWTVEYGSHPLEFACTSEKLLKFVDLRDGKSRSVLSLPSPAIPCSRPLLFSKRSPWNSMQQFVVMAHEVVLMDHRFSSSCISQWNHMLLNFPTSCDLVQLGDELVCMLNDQQIGETCCISLKKTGETMPLSYPVFHISKPSDIPAFLLGSNHTNLDVGIARFNKPVIGCCGLVNNGDFNDSSLTAFHLTSIGDLFSQKLNSTYGSSPDKTFIPSYGFSDRQIDRNYIVSVVEKWMDGLSTTKKTLKMNTEVRLREISFKHKSVFNKMIGSFELDDCQIDFDGMNSFIHEQQSKHFEVPQLALNSKSTEDSYSQNLCNIFNSGLLTQVDIDL